MVYTDADDFARRMLLASQSANLAEYKSRLSELCRDIKLRTGATSDGMERYLRTLERLEGGCQCGGAPFDESSCHKCLIGRLETRMKNLPDPFNWIQYAAVVQEAVDAMDTTQPPRFRMDPEMLWALAETLTDTECQQNKYIEATRVNIYLECIRCWYPLNEEIIFPLEMWKSLSEGDSHSRNTIRVAARYLSNRVRGCCRLIFPYTRNKNHFVTVVVLPPRNKYRGAILVWDSLSGNRDTLDDCVPESVRQSLHTVGVFRIGETPVIQMPCHRQTKNDCAMFMLQHIETIARFGYAIPWLDNNLAVTNINEFIGNRRAGPENMMANRQRLCRFTNQFKHKIAPSDLKPYRGLLVDNDVEFRVLYLSGATKAK